jgi:hypothetical protein
MIEQLTTLESERVNNNAAASTQITDNLVEELAAEYRAYLKEFGASSQAKPATTPVTGNTATSGATTSSTTQADTQAQQELEKNISQLKPALGTNIDPKKTAQALQAAVSGQQTSTLDATKGLAPALGKMLADPSLAGQFKNLLNKLK